MARNFVRNPRGLGFTAVPLSPSPDPFSIAFDVAAIAGPALFELLRGKAHLDANKITPEQNRFHLEVLAPAVDAKDNPATPIEDLIAWDQELRRQGEAFYEFVQQFDKSAAAGAVRTIFGALDAAGNWITTSAAPGYATSILADLERIIGERTGMKSQLGIDWGKLVQTGVQVAANLTKGPVSISTPGGTVTAIPPTQSPGRYYNPYPAVVGAVESVPGWVWGGGAVLVAALIFMNSGGRRR